MLLAQTSAPPESVLPPQPATSPQPVAPNPQPVKQTAPRATSVQPTRAAPAPAPQIRTASPSTLEQLAAVGQATAEEASACFRDAWNSGRLTEDHVALHMTFEPGADGPALHVTAPNTSEHLWDAEACLAALYNEVPVASLSEEPGGMIWSLRLPTQTWAEEPTDGMSP